jgi:hypothetical protein
MADATHVDVYTMRMGDLIAVKADNTLQRYTPAKFADYVQQRTDTVARKALLAVKYLFSAIMLRDYIDWAKVRGTFRTEMFKCTHVTAVYAWLHEHSQYMNASETLVAVFLQKGELNYTPEYVGGPSERTATRKTFTLRHGLSASAKQFPSPDPLKDFLVFLPFEPFEKADDSWKSYAFTIPNTVHFTQVSRDAVCMNSSVMLYFADEALCALARRPKFRPVSKKEEFVYYAGRVRLGEHDVYAILTPYYGHPSPRDPNVAVRVEEGRGQIETRIRTWEDGTRPRRSPRGTSRSAKPHTNRKEVRFGQTTIYGIAGRSTSLPKTGAESANDAANAVQPLPATPPPPAAGAQPQTPAKTASRNPIVASQQSPAVTGHNADVRWGSVATSGTPIQATTAAATPVLPLETTPQRSATDAAAAAVGSAPAERQPGSSSTLTPPRAALSAARTAAAPGVFGPHAPGRQPIGIVATASQQSPNYGVADTNTKNPWISAAQPTQQLQAPRTAGTTPGLTTPAAASVQARSAGKSAPADQQPSMEAATRAGQLRVTAPSAALQSPQTTAISAAAFSPDAPRSQPQLGTFTAPRINVSSPAAQATQLQQPRTEPLVAPQGTAHKAGVPPATPVGADSAATSVPSRSPAAGRAEIPQAIETTPAAGWGLLGQAFTSVKSLFWPRPTSDAHVSPATVPLQAPRTTSAVRVSMSNALNYIRDHSGETQVYKIQNHDSVDVRWNPHTFRGYSFQQTHLKFNQTKLGNFTVTPTSISFRFYEECEDYEKIVFLFLIAASLAISKQSQHVKYHVKHTQIQALIPALNQPNVPEDICRLCDDYFTTNESVIPRIRAAQHARFAR